MDRYDPAAIETRWQAIWEREGVFDVPNPGPGDPGDDLTYVLEMLPYPSGELHMGHVKNYTMGDVVTLYRRRNGYRVMHPMGYDAFGLPAENAAIRAGRHPAESTRENIAADPPPDEAHGLVDRLDARALDGRSRVLPLDAVDLPAAVRGGPGLPQERAVKWCPNDQTVLANEQVIDGHCERCGAEVEARTLEQWFFKITAYADRLLDDLAAVHWPERVVTMQRNWIGRSHGAEVELPRSVSRAPSLRGVHDPARHAVRRHLLRARAGASAGGRARGGRRARRRRSPTTCATPPPARRSSGPRSARRPASSPAGTSSNPVNGEQIPVWVADYVLAEYGTGAIMAVPAHDERDFEFAQAHGLDIRQVVAPRGGASRRPRPSTPRTATTRCSSTPASSAAWRRPRAPRAIIARLEAEGRGAGTIAYRLRDWLLSRQRYWGCPIPVVHCAGCGIVAVPDDQLPVVLPDIGRLRAARPLAARGRRGLGEHRVPEVRRPRAARDRHDGHVRRLVLVLHALRRPAQRPGAVQPRGRR